MSTDKTTPTPTQTVQELRAEIYSNATDKKVKALYNVYYQRSSKMCYVVDSQGYNKPFKFVNGDVARLFMSFVDMGWTEEESYGMAIRTYAVSPAMKQIEAGKARKNDLALMNDPEKMEMLRKISTGELTIRKNHKFREIENNDELVKIREIEAMDITQPEKDALIKEVITK